MSYIFSRFIKLLNMYLLLNMFQDFLVLNTQKWGIRSPHTQNLYSKGDQKENSEESEEKHKIIWVNEKC